MAFWCQARAALWPRAAIECTTLVALLQQVDGLTTAMTTVYRRSLPLQLELRRPGHVQTLLRKLPALGCEQLRLEAACSEKVWRRQVEELLMVKSARKAGPFSATGAKIRLGCGARWAPGAPADGGAAAQPEPAERRSAGAAEPPTRGA